MKDEARPESVEGFSGGTAVAVIVSTRANEVSAVCHKRTAEP